jgi:hypothetical protein
MATIIIGSYMVRYPLGGNLSWALQYLCGFKELGHDVYLVEKSAYPNSCYDPVKKDHSDDCSYGVKVVSHLLSRYGLENKWCYVESGEVYHGLSKRQINAVFERADLYIEAGAHYSWTEESTAAIMRVYIDVDPGYSHIKMYHAKASNAPFPVYDRYFTNGLNVGRDGNVIPTLGINWSYIFNPVNSRLFNNIPPPSNAPYSTIMNWKSYESVEYNGISYGQKDVEFEKFLLLPKQVEAPIEVAVSGIDADKATILRSNGWAINNAQQVTLTVDSFKQYVSKCRGEFSVCKNVYTATSSGWFSDKSAAYLASGRPVVVQETGFSEHLPTGEGLFAVNNVAEAKDAIETIEANYQLHSKRAIEIANEYLDTKVVLKNFLNELGV